MTVIAAEEAGGAGGDPSLNLPDGFCSLVGDNLGQQSQALDDWRLQLLELLPAAKLQLSDAQVGTSLMSCNLHQEQLELKSHSWTCCMLPSCSSVKPKYACLNCLTSFSTKERQKPLCVNKHPITTSMNC